MAILNMSELVPVSQKLRLQSSRCWFQFFFFSTFGFVWSQPAVQTCLWGLKKCVQDYNWNVDYAELF